MQRRRDIGPTCGVKHAADSDRTFRVHNVELAEQTFGAIAGIEFDRQVDDLKEAGECKGGDPDEDELRTSEDDSQNQQDRERGSTELSGGNGCVADH